MTNYVVSIKYFYGTDCNNYKLSVLSNDSTSEADSMALIDYIIFGINHCFPVYHWVICDEETVNRIRRAVDKANKLLQIKSL